MRTLGSVFKRGKVYYIIFTHRGRRYKESSGSTKRKVAIALLRKRIAEVVEGRIMPSAERTTFDDLVKLIEADYAANGRKSRGSLDDRVNVLRERFGKFRPADIAYADISKYVDARRVEKAAAATVKYEVVVLGRMLRLGVQAGLLKAVPPLPTIKVDNARKGMFKDNELARVLAHLPDDIAPTIEFVAITGWRIGEARKLTWAHVHGGQVRLAPAETKGGEGRVFPFRVHPRLARLMQEQKDRTDALQRRTQTVVPWVFPRADGRPLGQFHKQWTRACREAGCPGRLVHDLRRRAVKKLVDAGIPEKVAMTITGHRTRSVFDRYHIVADVDVVKAVRKLAEQGD